MNKLYHSQEGGLPVIVVVLIVMAIIVAAIVLTDLLRDGDNDSPSNDARVRCTAELDACIENCGGDKRCESECNRNYFDCLSDVPR